MITSRRSSLPFMMCLMFCRVVVIRVSTAVPRTGKKRSRCSGGGNGRTSLIRSSSVGPIDKTGPTDDERIKEVRPLPPPEHLLRFFPVRGTAVETLITNTRQNIKHIMNGKDDRLLVIIGPCSIHDPAAAMEYAHKLRAQRAQYADTLEIVMRVYFEKPRTTVGWKGLINDPGLDESYRIDEGLRIARQLLSDINRARPAGGWRVSRHHLAAVHRRPDQLGRHRCAHHRKSGAS